MIGIFSLCQNAENNSLDNPTPSIPEQCSGCYDTLLKDDQPRLGARHSMLIAIVEAASVQ